MVGKREICIIMTIINIIILVIMMMCSDSRLTGWVRITFWWPKSHILIGQPADHTLNSAGVISIQTSKRHIYDYRHSVMLIPNQSALRNANTEPVSTP